MTEDKKLAACGFTFFTENDAKLAALEQKKIEYLEKRMDYSKPENILIVYNRTIKERVFKTPVGMEYLRKIQLFLQNSSEVSNDDIMDIPMYVAFDKEVRAQTQPATKRIKPSKSEMDQMKSRMLISVIINILLGFAIIAMFTIALRADNPNILNYKRAITNQYASWEEDLTQREAIIREKEKELHINE